MRTLATPLTLACLLALAGCATLTPEQRAERIAAEMETLKQQYGPACDRLGYARDSDGWRNCLLSLANRDACERYREAPVYLPSPLYYYPRPVYRPAPKPAP